MGEYKAYLGDGVCADFDGLNVILTTEDGVRATNTIVLEPEVRRALDEYRDRLVASRGETASSVPTTERKA